MNNKLFSAVEQFLFLANLNNEKDTEDFQHVLYHSSLMENVFQHSNIVFLS